MKVTPLRIGLVGAGANTRGRHIPGFQALPGVEIVGIANRTRTSSEAVAKAHGIPKVYDTWEALVAAPDIDAICIGTWPNLHCAVTLAALEHEKHVLCEARMAMNAKEAHQMLAAAQAKPHLVAQVVPAPFTLAIDRTIRQIIAQGKLGDILAVWLHSTSSSFINRERPFHWREDVEKSGFNTLTLGIWYETLMRWLGPANQVMALTKTCVPTRTDETGKMREIHIPDYVEVICQLEQGATAHLCFSSTTGLAPKDAAWIFGSEGTLSLDIPTLQLFLGTPQTGKLAPVPIPKEDQIGWRVEASFVAAICGEEPVTLTTFADGVKYMEFTEAVHQSSTLHQAIPLPFTNF